MDSFLQLQSAVQLYMSVGSESVFISPEAVKLALNMAYRKVGGLFRWPDLEDAKKTSTISGQEYYDFPRTWRPNSAWKLEIDGKDQGDPINFKDYLYEKENNYPSGSTKMWGNQWRRFFIDPVPTTNGSFNLVIWGFRNVETLVEDADVTIFSYAQPEVNEALVLEAVAILKAKKEKGNEGIMFSLEAKQIVSVAWSRVKQDLSKYEKTLPFFDVPDFFGSNQTGVKNNIGKF
mgnify:CR=1 FL=1